MCMAPKMPKMEVKDPAPPPPPPEESAAFKQGAPEYRFSERPRGSRNSRNKLRIDRDTSSRRTVSVPHYN